MHTGAHRWAASGHTRHESLLKNSPSASRTSEPARLTTALSLPASPGRRNIHQIPPPPTSLLQIKSSTEDGHSQTTACFQDNSCFSRKLWSQKSAMVFEGEKKPPLEKHYMTGTSLIFSHDICAQVPRGATFPQES